MRKWVHILTNIDSINKKAICKSCGEVKITQINKNGVFRAWRCSVKHSNDNKYKYGYSQRKSYYKTKYGFLIPDKIIKHGICRICSLEKELVIDHCHKKRKFRGFICRNCNVMLGFGKDNVDIFKNAIKYLESF